MNENKNNTGNAPQLINSFIKGMNKDVTDVFVPESVWINAINAITNTHNGELGSIGNEQSNLYCETFPYQVIGILNKYKSEWVVYSTDNISSEIGLFDESTCTYTKLVNDPCLNFSTYNLITGSVKMNYDCTYSAYWQDNLNPDRTMNLDPTRIPYICTPKTITVVKDFYNYVISSPAPANPCGVGLNVSGGQAPDPPGYFSYNIGLGAIYGLVTLSFNAYSIPDRFVVEYDGVDVIDTGYRGVNGYCVPVVGPGSGTASFMKTTLTTFAILKVYAPCGGTAWKATLGCPDPSAPGTPPLPPPASSSNIFYEDQNGNIIEVPAIAPGQSITICALDGSVNDINVDSIYTINQTTICAQVDEVLIDPNACGEEICTTNLDCDQLRLHPLITQPCVTVSKSQGSGQLNNGTYQAVIAYSENGIKLTDYSMPSNPQGLWDHSGIGGSIDINISNLDQNFEEFQLVVIGTVNQQSTAKIIGYYSINQTQIHLDLINASLVTADLSIIPLKSVVYEKSEKMFDIGGYLLRSGVTSQPFFNYQPLANNIKVNWVSVQYPSDYYWNGGNEVGYMRDEIYSFFIRWVYKTGARSASFHIPGRSSISSDLALEPLTSPDLIELTRRKRWQVYDTSSITSTATSTRPDGGVIIARGDMAYWESTENYPNSQPEVWGDLCNAPIRHHKMPSNETTHIHNAGGSQINVLGVEFTNILQPTDINGNPLTDIIGYEILRGSREGNRSILAKGLFNNMVEYTIQGNTSIKGLFQNYPYNDLRTDPFMHTPGDLIYRQDIFSFHAPENNLVKPYIGSGGYVRIYTEETGTAKFTPELPYKHPQFKFMSEQAFAGAALVSAGVSLLSLMGKKSSYASSTGHTTIALFGETNTTVVPWAITVPGIGGNPGESNYVQRNATTNFDKTISTSSESGTASVYSDLINHTASTAASAAGSGGIGGPTTGGLISVLSSAVTAFAVAGQAAMTFYHSFDTWLKIIYEFISYRDYVLQINSHGFYNNFSNIVNPNAPSSVKPSFNRLMTASSAKYTSAGLQDFNSNLRINNLNRNRFLTFQTVTTIPNTSNIDSSRNLIPNTNNAFASYDDNISSYYGAIKYDYQNQYGQLYAITQIPVNSCVYDVSNDVTIPHSSSQIFGGDVYINRYTEKSPYYFYNSWLIDVPNGTEWNYQNYINGPEPEYWLNSIRYDASLFNISLTISLIPEFGFNSPADYYNLHGYYATGSPISSSFKNAWMYLSNNSIRDFFTESELNLAFRDYGENSWEKFYDPIGNSFSDISLMFRADLITKPTYYEYDLSLSASRLYSNFSSWSNILPRDYDPAIYTTCFEYYPRRVIYSLQQQEGLKRDNWRNYLQFNYKDFEGKVNTIKSLNAQGSVILFEDAEPMQFVGIDTFQSAAGVKYTTGDAGLFQQNMQSIVNADDSFEYGTCISSKSVVNTPFGLYWVSQLTGKILNYAGSGITDISLGGMKYWFLQNLPSPLLQQYPDFPLYDNVVEGIAVQTVFDSQYELLYFTKKDYQPTAEFAEIADCIVYIPGQGYFINESLCNEAPLVITCPTGFTYNSATQLCEKITTFNICPVGYTYNAIDDQCELEVTELASCDTCIQLLSFDYSNFGACKTTVFSADTPTDFTYIDCSGVSNTISVGGSPGGNGFEQISVCEQVPLGGIIPPNDVCNDNLGFVTFRYKDCVTQNMVDVTYNLPTTNGVMTTFTIANPFCFVTGTLTIIAGLTVTNLTYSQNCGSIPPPPPVLQLISLSNSSGSAACPFGISTFPIQVWAYQPVVIGSIIYGTNIGTTPFPGDGNWYYVTGTLAYRIDVNGVVLDVLNCSPTLT